MSLSIRESGAIERPAMIQDRGCVSCSFVIRSLVYSSFNSTFSSIKANRIVSGILSFASHLTIVLALTLNLLANSAWLIFQLRRPIFNSNPVMLSFWSLCQISVKPKNLNPCHWQFVTNRVPISDILPCDFYSGEKSNSCSHLW